MACAELTMTNTLCRVMRAPKINVITKDSYDHHYWPSIRQALTLIIQHPEQAAHFSQEELIRNIFNLCCQRHTISLYNDLMGFMMEYLNSLFQNLLTATEHSFLLALSNCYSTYSRIVAILGTVFIHLEKVHIRDKLNNTLSNILNEAFNKVIIESPEVQLQLKKSLNNLQSKLDPTQMMNLIKGLYNLNRDYATINRDLFALYIPCLQPSRGIEVDAQETQEIILYLKHQGFGAGEERVLKRKYFIAETL